MHRSIEVRLVVLPLAALAGALLYQGTNPAIYYVVGMVVYFWAFSEGEVRLFFSIVFSMVFRGHFGLCFFESGRLGCLVLDMQ